MHFKTINGVGTITAALNTAILISRIAAQFKYVVAALKYVDMILVTFFQSIPSVKFLDKGIIYVMT